MKRRPNVQMTLAMLFVLLAAAGVAAGEPATESAAASDTTTAATPEDSEGGPGDSAPGGAGLRVYLDPETGELRSRPADPDERSMTGRRELTPQQRLNTYGGDLLQEPLARGGYKVDLRGRFQRSVVATIDPETDAVTVDCVSAPATREPTTESEAADDE